MAAKIDRVALKAKLDRNEPVVLVEALPPRHFTEAHLPGAVNIPHDQVDALAPRLLPDKDADIVVYCANTPCRNSTIAADRLAHLGYTRVSDYKDGKEDWAKAGFALEAGVPG
jgi:rhodanese-related sulfurtransferase